MKIKYTKLFKILCTISLFFFMVGISTFFLPKIEAEVTDIRYASFGQGGYGGLPHSSFFGSNSALLFATYEYEVNFLKYNGWGLAEDYDGVSVSVKYRPFLPSITLSSSAPYFVFCGFFLFLAFGVRSVVVWASNILRKNTS